MEDFPGEIQLVEVLQQPLQNLADYWVEALWFLQLALVGHFQWAEVLQQPARSLEEYCLKVLCYFPLLVLKTSTTLQGRSKLLTTWYCNFFSDIVLFLPEEHTEQQHVATRSI